MIDGQQVHQYQQNE